MRYAETGKPLRRRVSVLQKKRECSARNPQQVVKSLRIVHKEADNTNNQQKADADEDAGRGPGLLVALL